MQQDGPDGGHPFRDHRGRRRAPIGAWEDRPLGGRAGHHFRSHMTAGGDAATVMRRCDVLGAFSEEPGRLTRPFASRAMLQVHEQVTLWMRDAGLAVRKDNVGNLLGRYESAAGGSSTLILGSHLDSVRGAGTYHGPLGVVGASARLQRPADNGARAPSGVVVVRIAQQEGLRYGTTYIGSKALAGAFDVAGLQRADAPGVTMAQAI